MRSALVFTMCLGLAACGGGSGDDDGGGSDGPGGGADARRTPDGGGGLDSGGSSCATHTLFVNAAGGTYEAGADNPAANITSLISQTSTVPAFGDAALFADTLTCVRALFAPYDLAVVDTEPASGDYVEIVFGGDPAAIDYPSGTLGVSPQTCDPIARSIGFVFPDALDAPTAQSLCELVGFQAGAIYGLEPAYLPRDVMSFILADMPKTFLDEDAPCGTFDEAPCTCGSPTQNSHEELLAALGPAPACL